MADLSSIRNVAGLVTTGIISSSASDANHAGTFAPESASIYSASIEECVTVACLADDHTIGCFIARTNSPVIGRLVS